MSRYLLFFAVLWFTACQKSEEYVPQITKVEPQVVMRGEIKEPGQSDFVSFELVTGAQNNDLAFWFWQGNVSNSELGGDTYIGGTYGIGHSRPFWGVQFWTAVSSGDNRWSEAQIESFFQPGKHFPFGKGNGKVDLLLRLPFGGPYDPETSRPSHLANPEGMLTVIAIEPFDYPLNTNGNKHSYGKLVHCTFSGQLGRYDSLADQADGDPSFFQTDEVVELRNGELVFYISYKEN